MSSRTNFLKKAGITAAHLAISATALSGGGHSYYRAQRGHYSPVSAITADLNLKPLATTSIKQKVEANSKPVMAETSSDLELNKSRQIRELIIVDGAVKDKHVIFKQAQPGVDIVEVPHGKDGMVELMKILSNYSNLDAVHLVSHAEAGAIHLGGQRIDQKELEEDVVGFAAINSAIRVGGDLMIYGCDVAQGQEGSDFLEIIQNNTHVDVAASNDRTGNEAYGGNWELEIQKGDIEATPLPESIAMNDFTGILQTQYVPDDFCTVGCAYTSPSHTSSDNHIIFDGSLDVYANDNYAVGGLYLDYTSPATSGNLQFSADGSNIASFELTEVNFATENGASCSSADVTGYLAGGGTVSDVFTLTGSGSVNLANLTGQQISKFRVNASGCNQKIYNPLRVVNFSVTNKQAPSTNNAPTNITLGSNSINKSDGTNAMVGTLSTEDDDSGDTHSYSLVAGTGDTDNSSFNISGSDLRANDASSLAPGSYSVRIQTDDGTDTFQMTFSITVNDDVAPSFENSTPSVGSITYTGGTVSADLTEDGNVYYVVVADGDGAPTSTQVKAGRNSAGAAALASGSFATSTTTGSEAFSGLAINTSYDLYAVAEDGIPNLQASAIKVDFKTSLPDGDADLTASGGVTEPVALPSFATSTARAIDIFDFTLFDGGGGDNQPLVVSSIDVQVSGTSTDAERGQVIWRLNGPDVANVTGTYDPGTDKITFSGLSISVADGGNETYTLNAYFNDNTNLIEDRSFVLSVDGNTDLTTSGNSTTMAPTSAINNGTGTQIDITATQLVFTTQPAGSVSGSALTTQPVVTARDEAGNTDVDFTETITISEASAGSLTNNTQAATNGVATFTELIYTATADQESFTLTANDQDGVVSNLPTVDANAVTSDVVATKLVFNTQPAPTSFKAAGTSTSFTTVPVVAALDANDIVDTGYGTGIALAEVNGAGTAALSGTGDTDGSASTVTIAPASGVATFTGLEINYSLNDANTDESFNLQATSGGLTSAGSAQLTAEGNTAPTVSSLPSDITVLEETQSNVDLSGTTFSDADEDALTITLEASAGSFGAPANGSGIGAGVTETLVNSTTITLAGAAADINTYLSTASNITYTGATNVSGDAAADINVHVNDSQINPNLGTINLDITDINDAPTLSATGQNPTFIEGDAAPGADLYSGVTASTVEATQRFAGLSLTITNVSNGASEILRLDGSDVALTDGKSVTTATNGLTAGVSISGSTATVSFSGASLTEAQMQTLVDGLSYRNTSDNPDTGSDRVVTITEITDNGGTDNGGVDEASPNLQSTVSLTPVNSPPVLGNLNSDNSGVQAGGSSVRIDNGGDATVSNPDSDDYNGGYLRVVDNGGNNTANGNFSLDGTNATANGDAEISAGETISVGGTAIGTVHATNDGQGGNSMEINFNSANANNPRLQTLLQNLRWGAGAGSEAQTFTLTLNDGDGIASGGDEDVTADFTMTLGNPPVIANLDGDAVDFLVDGPPVTLDALAGATLSDADTPASLNGGSLTATVSSGAAAAEDILQLSTAGAVSLSGSTAGSNVSVSGTVVGTLGNNIAAGNDLQVNFNTNATLARVEVLLQNLQYDNNASPVAEASRQVSVTVTDNDGFSSDLATVSVNTTTRPEASNLSISGTLKYDETVTATYDYTDADGDAESGSTYKWFRSDDGAGTNRTAITDATNLTYTLAQADIGKYISFEVTPNDGTMSGSTVESDFSGPIASPFAGGDGTEADPYEIATAEQLDYVRDFLDQHFEQTADIDMDVAPFNQGAGWVPIGIVGDRFIGAYDGSNYTISNLLIDRPTQDNVGLIGLTTPGAAIKNLHLVNVDVSGRDRTGGLLGESRGDVSNVSVTGAVKGTNYIGGIFGLIEGNSIVTASYSTADVTGSGRTGGLTGYIYGTLTNSYVAGGTVSGGSASSSGGLIGEAYQSAITNTYAANQITGAAAIIGFSNGSTFSNNFWDTEITGEESSLVGTGVSSGELKTKTTFTNATWDFDTVWQIDEPGSGNISYPYLQNNTQDPAPGSLEVTVPVVSTGSSITSITDSSAIVTGNVTDDGNLTLSDRGFVWSVATHPDIHDNVESSGTGSGNFSKTVENLPPGTTIYVRAYATNQLGTSYGSEESFKTEKPELVIGGSFTVFNKVYDGDTTAVLDHNNLTLTDIFGGHDVTLTGVVPGFTQTNVGSAIPVAIAAATLSGDDADRYTLSLTNAPTASAHITARSITITADPVSIVYGDADPGLSYKISSGSLATGEQLSGELSRGSGQNIGVYTIRKGTLTAGSNYDLTYIGADYEITPATLLVSVDKKQWKFEGSEDPDFKYTAKGFVFDDEKTLINGVLVRDVGETPGSYTIRAGSLSAGVNYEIDFTGADFSILRTPPVVVQRSPGKDEGRVALDGVITAEFDHDITVADAGQITLTAPDATPVPLAATADGPVLTLTHGGLTHHTGYTLAIGKDALENVDGVGNKAATWSFTTIMPAPVAETLSPVDGATQVGVNDPLTIFFSQDVTLADATGISIVSGQGGSPSGIRADLSGNVLTISHDGLDYLTEYTVSVPQATVQNTDGVGNEPFSWRFTSIVPLPDPVVLVAPADQQGTVDLASEFEWEPTDHAGHYRIQVSDEETFAAPLEDVGQLTGPAFTPAEPLSDYRTYFWRVKAANEAGESEWSDVRRFTTIANTPAEVFPLMNAEHISTAPMPEWHSGYQTTYRIQLADSDDFAMPVADSLTTNRAVQMTGLDEDADYYWRVRVEASATTSEWTDAIRFRTRPAASTDDAEQVVDHSVTFGDTSNQDERVISELDYRMVGLPGNNHHGVEDFFPGRYGREWKVFYENGNDTEYYDEYEQGDERFVFAPGRGFWVLSTDIMDLDLKITSVATNERDAYSVPLHPGWNIITNPHRGPVSWGDVQQMNDFTGDAWGYDQRFVLADTLHPVQGYYVYNHPDQPRDYLDIPYATMEQRRSEERGKALLAAHATTPVPAVHLSAQFQDNGRFDTQILYPDLAGRQADGDEALDDESLRRYYPSLEMSRSGMMLVNEDHMARGGLLREVSRFDADGAEYELHLKGETGHRFTWKLTLQQMPEQAGALIVNRANDTTWLLTHGEEVETTLTEPNAVYDLYTGDRERLEQLQKDMMPQEFALTPNYPNPFNPITNIRYSIPSQQHVRLEVYDVIGRRVKVLTNNVQQAGWHVVQFDAGSLASGVYLYRLTTDNHVKVRKMTLVK